MDEFEIHLDRDGGRAFAESVRGGRFCFALVISHTDTSGIPGLTAAGSGPEMVKFTPPADAEFLHYGRCACIDRIPATPDGKPTPALLTKAALESASIPHVVINAGSRVDPALPFFSTGLPPGGNIAEAGAMRREDVARAVDFGKIVGRTLASLTDCLVVGESLPAGTTTAMAVLRGMGFGGASVSSSHARNPLELKESVVGRAMARLAGRDPFSVVSNMGDPMIPLVAGILSAASRTCRVMLAGGTQMAAVLAFAGGLGYRRGSAAVGTTTYVTGDGSANMLETVGRIGAGIPVLAVDPMMSESRIPGLRAFSEGFAKEGVGAGGSVISAMLKSGLGRGALLRAAEREYGRALTSR